MSGPSPRRLADTAAWLARHPGDLRHVPAWYRSMRGGGQPLQDGTPWLTYGARGWLQETVRPSWRVFEWGCGGSTIYFARRVEQLISVEHDPTWHGEVERALAREKRLPPRQELHLVEPAGSGAKAYRSDHTPGPSFQRYASRIDSFDEATFDLIVVDGRVRNACIAHAIPRLRPGGWLLLDNAERPRYAAGCALLDAQERVELRGMGPWAPTPWLTTAWRVSLPSRG